ncbi:LysR substrate-binding domain-containing protein [Acidovorax sp. SDU_ACID1]|uniref:LysR substrate-binding domain-containing protein n=1 Tax=Acidovorax sp. SDU_ACID1 TaxID=3136632 RepID=UPI0038739818
MQSIKVWASTISVNELSTFVERFILQHPGLDCTLAESSAREITNAIKTAKADIGVLSGPIREDALVYIPLKLEHLVLLVPPQHPLMDYSSVAFERALQYEFVGLGERNPLQQFITRTAEASHQRLKVRAHTHNFDALCSLVHSGAGIAVLPLDEAEPRAARGYGSVIKVTDGWAVRELQAVVQRDRDTEPLIAEFLSALTAGYRCMQVATDGPTENELRDAGPLPTSQRSAASQAAYDGQADQGAR